jgi:hypothetical protein
MALYRNDAEAVARQLQERGSPAARRRTNLRCGSTRRSAWVRPPSRQPGEDALRAVRRTVAFAEESARPRHALSAPLGEVLERGASSGALAVQPDQDAATIYASWRLVAEALGRRATMNATEAAAHVRRFCFLALGIGFGGLKTPFRSRVNATRRRGARVTLKDETAVVGVGATPVLQAGAVTPADRVEMACGHPARAEDAGLTIKDLDGFAIYSGRATPPRSPRCSGSPRSASRHAHVGWWWERRLAGPGGGGGELRAWRSAASR